MSCNKWLNKLSPCSVATSFILHPQMPGCPYIVLANSKGPVQMVQMFLSLCCRHITQAHILFAVMKVLGTIVVTHNHVGVGVTIKTRHPLSGELSCVRTGLLLHAVGHV